LGQLLINEVTLKETSDLIAAAKKLTAGRPAHFMTGPRCFSDAELRELREYVDHEGAPAEVLSEQGQKPLADVRRTQVCWLDYERHRSVYDLIWTIATTANQLLQYDIASVPERIQLAVYDAKDQGFFEWHMDAVPSDMTRKISISVPLNDPAEYEGGVMEFNQGTSAIRMEQARGVPIIFPSWLVHRITPVTAGKRYSLVAWIRGPNWR
jgi:predicted 2-oxoglutarate/Fe(II)-dependent dioxygenase YbiX